jgi:hypothetical protein
MSTREEKTKSNLQRPSAMAVDTMQMAARVEVKMEAARRRCHLWPREVKVVVVVATGVVTVGFILFTR